MKVYVLSKANFDKLVLDRGITQDNIEDWFGSAFISINNCQFDDSLEDEKPTFTESKSNLLVTYFDDITEEKMNVGIIGGEPREIRGISQAQAQEIYDFIVRNRDKSTFVVHCYAGVSRSAAVGEFIARVFNIGVAEYRKLNPVSHPNPRVTKLLNDIHV